MRGRIGNIVFDALHGGSLQTYGREAGGIADLYAELLGMRRISRADMHREHNYPADEGDEVDPIVRPREPGGISIAFECQEPGYEPPRWPDPAYPQQIHLDVFVADMDATERLVSSLGATKLREADDHRAYADAAGHPFCMYPDPTRAESHGRIGRIVFDCFSPRSLASFYEELMDMPTRVEDSPERVVIAREDGSIPMLAFQHVVAPAPRWPDPRYPEQVHLDLGFDDTDAARELAVRLGAVRLPMPGHHVYADPAGHPFCV